MKLYPHQETAVGKMHNGCILWALPGSGKSRAAVAYYMRNEAPKSLYIITTAKKRDALDWDEECAGWGIGKAKDATLAGVLTVDSWNNIGNYVEVENAFFVFDEQRLVGSGAWVKHFLRISQQNRWILLSATPGDTWLDYIPVFIANGFYRNRTEFIREHVVYKPYSKFPKVDRYLTTGKLVRNRNALIVHMPYTRHTTSISKEVYVDYDQDTMEQIRTKRWNVYENRPIKRIPEVYSLMRRVVNSDPRRLEALLELVKKHPRLIIFYNFDYELEILRTIPTNLSQYSQIELAEWNGHKHEPVPDAEKWVYLVQYLGGSEAWNCTTTDAMVFYSLTYSYRQFSQAQGRVDRMNTEFQTLYYYTLLSKSPIDTVIRKALKEKRNFNETTSNLVSRKSLT